MRNQFRCESRQQIICTLIYDTEGNKPVEELCVQICSALEQWFPNVVCDLLMGHTNNLSGPGQRSQSRKEQIEYDRQPRTV